MTKEKKKRSVFKRFIMWSGIGIIGIVLGVVIASMFSSGGDITLNEFQQLRDGMSYEEAKAIIGADGTISSETGAEGDPAHTVTYDYKGTGEIGANAILMFQGGKLITKAQNGLK